MENFNPTDLVKILSLDLEKNNIGLTKAKKWLSSFFGIFDEELDALYDATNDIGEAVSLMETFDSEEEYSLKRIIQLLELDCSSRSLSFDTIQEAFLSMSDYERKWFVKFWIRTPNNKIGEKTIQKVLAKKYNKTQQEVQRDCSLNSIVSVTSYYEMNRSPPLNLVHGKFVSPMLAKVQPFKKWPEDAIYDIKYDGNRYQIHKKKDSVIIFNRKGKVVNAQFPDVIEKILAYEEDNFILDGEIYPVDGSGYPVAHQQMNKRVHSKNINSDLILKCPVEWVVFDCLKMNGVSIMAYPLRVRIETFSSLPNQAIRVVNGDPFAFYNQAIAGGFEGIMVKDMGEEYHPSKRKWIKYKPAQIDLDVVITGAKYGEHSNTNLFSSFEISVLSSSSDSGYEPIGRVGIGFSDDDLVSLTAKCRRLVSNYNASTENHSITPSIIISVTADAVTRNTNGTLGLRFPRKDRIRDDKILSQINTIDDVINLF